MLSVSVMFHTDPLTLDFLKNKHMLKLFMNKRKYMQLRAKSGTKPFMILILQLHVSFFCVVESTQGSMVHRDMVLKN
jgi:hypothetical protein